LLQAEQIIKVGLPVREIGKVIEETIASYGYTSIKNLSGHGLGYYKIHTAPNIPNYYDRSTAVVKAGMTFAIEPFATNGVGFIYDAGSPMIFSLLRTFPKSFQVPPLLKEKVHSFQGLPFSMQDLISTGCPLPEVQSFLNHCMENQIIAGYGALVEEAHGWVAQAENSVLVDEDGHVTISTR
jgi:methionyl aminopeptidase